MMRGYHGNMYSSSIMSLQQTSAVQTVVMNIIYCCGTELFPWEMLDTWGHVAATKLLCNVHMQYVPVVVVPATLCMDMNTQRCGCLLCIHIFQMP